MKPIRSFVFIIIFFAVSLIPLIAMPFYKNSGSSENRALAGLPRLVDNGAINKDFFSEMSDYFSDHFAYRVDMVELNEFLYTSVLNYSTNEKVILGRHGWLYFNETINDFIGRTGMDDSKIDRLVTVLSLEREYLNSLGIKYIFTIAPNKNTVYPEYMPGRFVKAPSPTVLEKLTQTLKKSNVKYSDLPSDIMDAKTDENLLYYKTDSHWNDLGARIAYNRLMRDIKLFFPDFLYDDYSNLKAVETTTAGDLEKMLFPLHKESNESCTALNQVKMYTTQKPFQSVEDAVITTVSSANSYRIMMFRDSFGNAIIPFLSNNFGYAFYSKEYPVNFKDIDIHAPDVVVQEIVQRNIPKLIEKAPVMPAVERKISFAGSIDSGGRVFSENSGNLVHVYGYLDSDDEKAYKCYITLSGRKTYEAFPILETEKITGFMHCDIQDLKKAAGFSLYLKSPDFTEDSFTVTIDFVGKTICHTFNGEEVNK